MILNNQLFLNLCNIAISAGLIINKYYKTNFKISIKDDKSPLTEADLNSNKYISESLSKIYPNIPILSEESCIDWSERRDWKTYWLIDPLDGTKEFINQNDEFTVNIALIEKNKPVFGVIYAPALFKLFYASSNNGSFKLNTANTISTLKDSSRIKTNNKKNKELVNIIGSRSHANEYLNQWIIKNFNEYNLIQKGSSLKFCEIAEGNADIYPRFGPTSEWDIAAGHIILTEAGGNLETIDNKKILYNTKESVINSDFIASCKGVVIRE